MISDMISDAIKMGVGAVALSKENLEKLTDNLTEMGKISKEEGAKILKDLEESKDKYAADVSEKVDSSVKKTLDAMGLVKKEEVDELAKRVAELEARLAPEEESLGDNEVT